MRTTSLSFLVVLSLAVAMPTAFHAQQPPGAPAAASSTAAQPAGGGRGAQAAAGRIGSIDERTSGMQKLDGYIPMYWDERAGALFLEIPRLDTELLFATGLSAGLGSNDIGLD